MSLNEAMNSKKGQGTGRAKEKEKMLFTETYWANSVSGSLKPAG